MKSEETRKEGERFQINSHIFKATKQELNGDGEIFPETLFASALMFVTAGQMNERIKMMRIMFHEQIKSQ